MPVNGQYFGCSSTQIFIFILVIKDLFLFFEEIDEILVRLKTVLEFSVSQFERLFKSLWVSFHLKKTDFSAFKKSFIDILKIIPHTQCNVQNNICCI